MAQAEKQGGQLPGLIKVNNMPQSTVAIIVHKDKAENYLNGVCFGTKIIPRPQSKNLVYQSIIIDF